MNGIKEGKFLSFYLDDGKVVKYDLSTGEMIGVKGEPVKSLGVRFSNLSMTDMIDSVSPKEYANFLRFVSYRLPRISNFGTLLKKAKRWSDFEQVFAQGAKISIHYCGGVPEQNFINFCKKYDIEIEFGASIVYQRNPNFFNLLFSLNTNELTKSEKESILNSSYYFDKIEDLINYWGYTQKALIVYLDYLETHEALNYSKAIGSLYDYTRMMRRISRKFDKYPRNLLTSHHIAIRNCERLTREYEESAFRKRINLDMEYSCNEYRIIYPKMVQDIKDEASQQHHCVATYIDSVIDGKCDILFLRNKEELDKSLVTMEVRDNKVVQARGRFNRDLTREEQEVVDRYNQYLENKFSKKNERK